jgi:hypothetical protein
LVLTCSLQPRDPQTAAPPSEWLEVAHNSNLLCLWGAIALAMLGQASARDLDDESRGLSGPCSAAVRQVRSASGTVPVSLENGQVIVNVIINGQGPFPMMFDTGGVEATARDRDRPWSFG